MDTKSAESIRSVYIHINLSCIMCRAIAKFPASMDKNERWVKIAENVPGKTKSDCIKRVKWIREQMLKKK